MALFIVDVVLSDPTLTTHGLIIMSAKIQNKYPHFLWFFYLIAVHQ